jgi:hypothetical protein
MLITHTPHRIIWVWNSQLLGVFLDLQILLRCLLRTIEETLELCRADHRQDLRAPQAMIVPVSFSETEMDNNVSTAVEEELVIGCRRKMGSN